RETDTRATWGSPSVSADGRFVAFHSYSTNLIASDNNGSVLDVFVTDMDPLAVTPVSLISVSGAGDQSDADRQDASISADGRFVAFASSATNLDTNLFPTLPHIYLRDTLGGTTTFISKNT